MYVLAHIHSGFFQIALFSYFFKICLHIYHPIVSPGGDFETFRHAFALDHQRMIAGRGKRLRQPFEDARGVMMDRRGLAMHQRSGVDNPSAERLANGLMPQANSENRHTTSEGFYQRHRYARFVGRARPGRNNDALRVERIDLLNGYFVIAKYADILAQLAQILDKVVGKRVIVINHQQHVVLSLLFGDVNPIARVTAAAGPLTGTRAEMGGSSSRFGRCARLRGLIQATGLRQQPRWRKKGTANFW